MGQPEVTVKYETEEYRVVDIGGKRVFVLVVSGEEQTKSPIDHPLRADQLPPETEVILRVPVQLTAEEPKEKIDEYPRKLSQVTVTTLGVDEDEKQVFDIGSMRTPAPIVPIFKGSIQIGEAEEFFVDSETGDVKANLRLLGNLATGDYFPSLVGFVRQKSTIDGRTHVQDFEVTGVALSLQNRGSRVPSVAVR